MVSIFEATRGQDSLLASTITGVELHESEGRDQAGQFVGDATGSGTRQTLAAVIPVHCGQVPSQRNVSGPGGLAVHV